MTNQHQQPQSQTSDCHSVWADIPPVSVSLLISDR
jgi:hypothetical protein